MASNRISVKEEPLGPWNKLTCTCCIKPPVAQQVAYDGERRLNAFAENCKEHKKDAKEQARRGGELLLANELAQIILFAEHEKRAKARRSLEH